MVKKISIDVDDQVYDRFQAALKLTDKEEGAAIEEAMKAFIAQSFAEVIGEYQPSTDNARKYWGKDAKRIPRWACHNEQYNHKIIAAYFEAIRLDGKATLPRIEELCADKEQERFYVPTFRTNYAQMKADGPKTHGRVFEDNGFEVWIWKEVADVMDAYSYAFIDLD